MATDSMYCESLETYRGSILTCYDRKTERNETKMMQGEMVFEGPFADLLARAEEQKRQKKKTEIESYFRI